MKPENAVMRYPDKLCRGKRAMSIRGEHWVLWRIVKALCRAGRLNEVSLLHLDKALYLS